MNRPAKLPVWRTIVAAYAFLFRNWREALRIGWIPVAATVVLGYLRYLLPSAEGWPPAATVLYGWAIWVAYTPIVAMAVVPWHRFILLGQRAGRGVVAIAFTAREGRYAMLTVAVMVIAHSMNWAGALSSWVMTWLSDALGYESNPFGSLIFVLFLATSFVGLYVFAMLCLALPATAVDRGGSLRRAVALGYGNGWRMVLVTLAVLAPYYAYYAAIINLPDAAFEEAWEFAGILVNSVFFIFEAFLAATAVSLCFRALGGLRGSKPGATTIPPSGVA